MSMKKAEASAVARRSESARANGGSDMRYAM